jgi:hypothetical protein
VIPPDGAVSGSAVRSASPLASVSMARASRRPRRDHGKHRPAAPAQGGSEALMLPLHADSSAGRLTPMAAATELDESRQRCGRRDGRAARCRIEAYPKARSVPRRLAQLAHCSSAAAGLSAAVAGGNDARSGSVVDAERAGTADTTSLVVLLKDEVHGAGERPQTESRAYAAGLCRAPVTAHHSERATTTHVADVQDGRDRRQASPNEGR